LKWLSQLSWGKAKEATGPAMTYVPLGFYYFGYKLWPYWLSKTRELPMGTGLLPFWTEIGL